MSKINKVGISLFVISSVISLVLLEVGLRIAGTSFNSTRMNTYISESGTKNYDGERDYELFKSQKPQKNKQIWAIGDSFTNAGNVTSDESYPAQLFSLLEENSYNYDVVNLGQCEDPTWGAYERLRTLLKNSVTKPEIIIFLVGVSDPFYYLFSSTNPIERKTQNIIEFKTEKSWFHELRIYKVYRHIKLNWITKNISQAGNKISEKKLIKLEEIYTEIKSSKNPNWQEIEKQIKVILDNHREFLDGTINEFKFEDKTRLISNTIITPLIRGYTGRLDYNKALETYLKFLIDYPAFFWNESRNGLHTLHTMSQIMMFQSKYTGEQILERLEVSIKQTPDLREGKLFKQAVQIFTKRKSIEEFVESERVKTWNKIFELQKKYGFKVVLQTYASDFNETNKMIKEIAHKKKIVLNDNHKNFKPYIQTYGRENIFADDNHFQPIGYKLMAKDLFKLMKDNKVIE